MSRRRSRWITAALVLTGSWLALSPVLRADERADRTALVNETLGLFKAADESLADTLAKAPGYAVFPKVTKAGIGLGGARGSGQVLEGGSPVGETTLTQVSIGLQLGGQAYAELIVFETADVLASFKQGKFAFSGQVSAVAVKSGSAKNASFTNGVKVLTLVKGGLMYEATVGGQKFSFKPYS